MIIQHQEAKTCYSILNDHYSGKKFFISVFGTGGLSGTRAFFSCENEGLIIYKRISVFEEIKHTYFMNPLDVCDMKSGWNVYELRIGVQIYMFID
jgi:hypothetical protein